MQYAQPLEYSTWAERIRHRTPQDRFVLTGADAIPSDELTEDLCVLLFHELGVTARRNLGLVPADLLTPAVCLAAIEHDVGQCRFVPHAAWSEEFILALFARCGPKRLWLAFGHIPDALKSESVCLAAVLSNGCALRHVPPPRRTEALCIEAVRSNGAAIDYLPDHLRTFATLQMAMGSNPEYTVTALRPDEVTREQCRELYLIGARRCGRALEEMLARRPEAVDVDVARAAVAQEPAVLDLLPPSLRCEAFPSDGPPRQH